MNVLIISGPTASGKSSLALKIAEKLNGQIINADVGQFYTKFAVGTAKPDLKFEKIPHHLFDVIDSPKNLSVCDYRNLLLDKVLQVQKTGALPIIVGGSLFYLKSLFFPPASLTIESNKDDLIVNLEGLSPWEFLNKIDSKRAANLNPADLYRINRAIKIWMITKQKPSNFKPKAIFPFNFFFLFLNPDQDLLEKKIKNRTYEMLVPGGDKKGWIEEVREIVNTPWEGFLKEKKLIGYPEILEWIKKEEVGIDFLIDEIVRKTKNYAKRQKVFWKSFKRELEKEIKDSKFNCELLEVDNINLDDQSTLQIASSVQNFLKLK